ncbi:hypothetical protein WJX84_006304 [Apatococcus fuscideae]|uniref:Condensin complex subunit 2 n=1 Tax=Apatococcus fuscideae TaxID=2026836 RepID=A0AAW1TDD8_9CHLO
MVLQELADPRQLAKPSVASATGGPQRKAQKLQQAISRAQRIGTERPAYRDENAGSLSEGEAGSSNGNRADHMEAGLVSQHRAHAGSNMALSSPDRLPAGTQIARHGPGTHASQQQQQALSGDQLAVLYSSCLKLASENKIDKNNTWQLGLIDHLSDLVKPSQEEEGQLNFQRASMSLDAGVKIYSHRVDSVHTVAFRMLCGLGRPGTGPAPDDSQDGAEPGDDGEGEASQTGRGAKAKRGAAVTADPSSTLESNIDALNVKKFDIAFAVDPLFHKTSAQFDEGGARGLLLHNLSVLHGCDIAFDSTEVPDISVNVHEAVPDVQVPLEGLQQQIAQGLGQNSAPLPDISPSLTELLRLAGASPPLSAAQEAHDLIASLVSAGASGTVDADAAAQGLQQLSLLDDAALPDNGAGGPADDFAAGFDDDNDQDGDSPASEPEPGPSEDAALGQPSSSPGLEDSISGLPCESASTLGQQEEGDLGVGAADDAPDVAEWLLRASQQDPIAAGGKAGWAGASHWKFRTRTAKPTASATDSAASGSTAPKRRPSRRKQARAVLDFENLPELPAGAFEVATSRDQICHKALPPAHTLLAPDCHFQASHLACLFLKPHAKLTSKRRGKAAAAQLPPATQSSSLWHSQDDNMGFPETGGDDDDDDMGHGGGWGDEGSSEAFANGSASLVPAPRQVARISVTYASAAKQVDVRVLKETLRDGLQALQSPDAAATDSASSEVSFQELLQQVPADTAAGKPSDLSVHLCFICVLHLANEHGLAITAAPSLDSMVISSLPACW